MLVSAFHQIEHALSNDGEHLTLADITCNYWVTMTILSKRAFLYVTHLAPGFHGNDHLWYHTYKLLCSQNNRAQK